MHLNSNKRKIYLNIAAADLFIFWHPILNSSYSIGWSCIHPYQNIYIYYKEEKQNIFLCTAAHTEFCSIFFSSVSLDPYFGTTKICLILLFFISTLRENKSVVKIGKYGAIVVHIFEFGFLLVIHLTHYSFQRHNRSVQSDLKVCTYSCLYAMHDLCLFLC